MSDRDNVAMYLMRRFLHTLLVPAIVLIASCMDRQYQIDFWNHLARGHEIVAGGALLQAEPFTFASEAAPVRDPNWLTQVLYDRGFAWGGIALVQLVNAVVLALSLALLFRLCRRYTKDDALGAQREVASGPACAACVIAFAGLWQTFLIRPQSLSFLLFVLLYTLLARGSRPAILILTPLMMTAWCNLHGGFAIAFVLIACFAGAAWREWAVARFTRLKVSPNERLERRRTAMLYTAVLLLAIVASLANPYGWSLYRYAAVLTRRAVSRHIEEWLPPTLHHWIGIAFLGSLLLLAALYVKARRRPKPLEIFLALAFIPLACHSVRMIPWWFLVIAPVMARLLSEVSTQGEPEPRGNRASFIPAVYSAILLALCVSSLPWLERFNPFFGSLRSSHRTESDVQLASDVLITTSGRVFSRLEWSEYLDWSLGPTRRVFVDGHAEQYTDDVWRDYCTISSAAHGWGSTVDRYAFDYLLLDATYHQTLLEHVKGSPRWKQVLQSGPAVLFARKVPS